MYRLRWTGRGVGGATRVGCAGPAASNEDLLGDRFATTRAVRVRSCATEAAAAQQPRNSHCRLRSRVATGTKNGGFVFVLRYRTVRRLTGWASLDPTSPTFRHQPFPRPV